ncbi:STE11 [Candida pseudojiufengensis]|uniref:STE11 n=1 Tax=Candida pseudojiufengensis TaxID=497109 RepID=UPI0022243082|nr:STE11 [Candida pseudojiufengensis]KAI5964791.1 STE11 [Candida pseudojiufengensis]
MTTQIDSPNESGVNNQLHNYQSPTNITQPSTKNETKELKSWLSKSNCQHLLQKFIDHGITLDLISELDSYSLKEIGILKVGDRLRLEIAINNLKNEKLKNLIDIETLYKKLELEFTPNEPFNNQNPSLNNLLNPSEASLLTQINNGSNVNLRQSQLQDQSQQSLQLPQQNASSSTTKSSSKNISFILQDGSIKRVNVTGCFNAQAIKRKILKKLGFKPQESTQFDTYIHSTNINDYRNLMDNFEPQVIMLYDVELVTICYSPERLEKHRIMLVPKNENPTESAIETSKLVMHKYNKTLKAQIKNELNFPDRSTTTNHNHADDIKMSKKDNQFSRSTMRNFFGQRPPSELISSNLAEYFPETKQKDLEQTVRNSVRFSVRLSKRMNFPTSGGFSSSSIALHNNHNMRSSIMSNNATGLPYQRAMSISSNEYGVGGGLRKSNRTIGEVMMNNITSIDEAVTNNDTSSKFSKPSLINQEIQENQESPKFNHGKFPNNTDVRSIISSRSISEGKALHRISIVASHDPNDEASNDRLSKIELLNPSDSEENDDEENYDDYIDNWGDDNSFENNECNVPDNWLKGSKIGSGSFGTVYLGMNPFTGELMAVKQIPLNNNNIQSQIQQSQQQQQAQDQAQTEQQQQQKPQELNLPTPTSVKDNNEDQPPELPQKSPLKSQPFFDLLEDQKREMMLLKELSHENIVRYFGSSTDENYLNIFLEYVPGGSVQTMLNSYGPFEEPLIRNFIRQVLIGLNYLHNEDIIHRDIKGANILIDIKGTVKIGDFGISKKVSTIDEEDDNFKKTGKRVGLQGSVFWMAPEVVKKLIYTKKADIWSVGALIIEMFTGRHPFPELSQMQALFKIGNHIHPKIPEWCTIDAKNFLNKTFELNFEKRPNAFDLLSDEFLNTLIASKQ